jgi:type IV pilus assembly protein PilE
MEVIVTVTILAILAAIAIPNYTEYIQRGRRADAKTALTQLAQWQERRRTETNSYATATTDLPGLRTVVSNGQTIYNVTVDNGATATAYALTATRAGVMANDACGDLTLTSLGVRGSVNGTRPWQECWAR